MAKALYTKGIAYGEESVIFKSINDILLTIYSIDHNVFSTIGEIVGKKSEQVSDEFGKELDLKKSVSSDQETKK